MAPDLSVPHRLVQKDPELMLGVCSVCGPVKIQRKSRGSKLPAALLCQPAFRARKALQHARAPKRTNPRHRNGRPDICEVCSRECETVWDHDHRTGEHRGWLCQQCNSALGFARDDVEVLRGLIAYLERD